MVLSIDRVEYSIRGVLGPVPGNIMCLGLRRTLARSRERKTLMVVVVLLPMADRCEIVLALATIDYN